MAGVKKVPETTQDSAAESAVATSSGGSSEPVPAIETPLEFMLRVMNDPKQKPETRARMAVAAAQYIHTKTGDGGKKDAKQAAAEKVAKGKFAPSAPPRLVVNNSR